MRRRATVKPPATPRPGEPEFPSVTTPLKAATPPSPACPGLPPQLSHAEICHQHVRPPFSRMMDPSAPKLPLPADFSWPVRLAIAAAIGLGLGLTLLHPSATRLLAWPWALFAALGWLLPIAVVLGHLTLRGGKGGCGRWIDGGLAALASAAVISALLSPQPALALPSALAILGACALPYALLPFFRSHRAQETFTTIGLVLLTVLGTSLVLWLQPWDWRGWPVARNPYPFGHANILGSVGVLATTWLLACAARSGGRARIGFAAGAVFSAGMTLSSESRGAVIALTAAVMIAAGLYFLRRGRLVLFLAVSCAVGAITVLANARLRELVLHRQWNSAARESNDQRTAMLLGGARLGAERPLLGWGPGSVPHVFPHVRGDLPGSADNVVQLHNSLVQTWATLGAAGLAAVTLLGAGLMVSLRRRSWDPDRIWLAAGMGGGFVLLLFDHPFAVPAFALLAAAHLAAWCAAEPPPPSRAFRLAGGIGLLALLPVLVASVRDLQARAAYADALDAFGQDDRAGYVDALRRASAAHPTDPYYRHLLAAHFAVGQPFPSPGELDPQSAVEQLKVTLRTNPFLEYAHYNLGWLLLDRAPAEAAVHFQSAAALAPQRGAVYFGLGLARLRLGEREGALRAFATEWLNDPAFAWSALWFESALASLRPEIREIAATAPLPVSPAATALRDAWAEIATPLPDGASYRRIRLGYGVLMDHPDGPPPVDFNVQTAVALPAGLATRLPPKGWLGGRFLRDFLTSSRPAPAP